MTLLSLLFALLIERVTTKTAQWRAGHYVELYVDKLISKQWLDDQADLFNLLIVIGLPFLIFLWFGNWLGDGFLALIFNTLVLFICLGCPRLRSTYKCYLQAADRGDTEACELHAQLLGHNNDESDQCNSFAQHLVWLNYTHYAAIIIGFIFFGAAGAVLYVLSYGIVERIRAENPATSEPKQESRALANANHLMWFIDYVPVRFTSLGFLLVGHFGRALPVWLHYLFDLSASAKKVLCKVSSAAEDIDAEDLEGDLDISNKHLSEPKILVKLAKRNIIFLMVVVSLLTVTGAIS